MDDQELLRTVPIFSELTDGDIASLSRLTNRRRYPKDTVVFFENEEGDFFFTIVEGRIKVTILGDDGREIILSVLGPGDFFGEMALLDGGPRSASAMAVDDTRTIALDRGDFRAMLESRPQAAMAVLAAVASRVREADEMAGGLAFLDVGGRVAKKLLELAASHGIRREDGVLLDVPLTQEEIANMVGVTRESVNRHLAYFRREGVIRGRGRRIVIQDAEALRLRAAG